PKQPLACPFFWGEELRVTYSGEITLGCCTPFKETFTYGNLLDTPFSEIWNNQMFQQNRARAKRNLPPTETCAKCDKFSKRFFEAEDAETAGPSPASAFVPMSALDPAGTP